MKKVLFDTPFLSLLFHQKNQFPEDPVTGKEVTNPKERIEYLIETLEQDDAKIIVPPQALAELLACAGPSGAVYLSELQGNTVFKLEPYDTLIAVENGALEESGARRVGDAPRQKTKVDRQIVAMAKFHKVEIVYSNDKDVKALCDDLGIRVVRVWELPLRPIEMGPLFATADYELNYSDESSSESEPPSSQSPGDGKPKETLPEPPHPSGPQAVQGQPPQGSSPAPKPPPSEK